MLSGLLTSYTIIGRLKNNHSPRIAHEYLSRFLRIVPTLAALVLFCTFVLPELGSGPQWHLVVNQHAEICKRNWWRNFLFIHNYFGFGDMVRIYDSKYMANDLIKINFLVFDAYTSLGHRYATVYHIANFDFDFMEMAQIRIDWIDWFGDIQYSGQILCNCRPSTVELRIFWGIVSKSNIQG